jgi:hypothetical protein
MNIKVKDIPDILIRFLIILLFLIVLIINIMEISNFGSSRAKLLSVSSKENNPSYDSLNLRYCNYSSVFSDKDAVDNNNLTFVIIYGILFVLFWYNTIVNLFSSSALSNEIKILFYQKYFNYDIYKKYNYEYTFIYGLQIFIIVAFLFHSYKLYSEFAGTNEEDIKIYDNLKIIDAAIIENIDCDLIRNHDPSKGKYITRDTLKDHLIKNMSSLKTKTEVSKYVKMCMAIILTNKNSNNAKKTIKDVKNLCDNPKCIYSRLENDMEYIFPENIDKYIDIIRSALKTAVANGYKELTPAELSQLYTEYKEIRKKLVDSFNVIKSHKSSHVIYYKLGLITTVLAGIFFATFGLAYFLIYDIKDINAWMFSMNGLPLPLDYFVSTFFNSAIVYIVAMISIYIAFIINF